MLASQISVFVRSYIVETENEVKNEVGNQKVHSSGDIADVDICVNLYYAPDVFVSKIS